MRIGIGELRLRPAEFWAMTPAEFLLAAGRMPAVAPMDRARLEALARQWPDGGKGG
ncbi:MAG: phage tail assembly chaperone [Rhodobacteraceae bacterium]|nr:phage tail assembly chaperone [Paracoccaceae bacterium]